MCVCVCQPAAFVSITDAQLSAFDSSALRSRLVDGRWTGVPAAQGRFSESRKQEKEEEEHLTVPSCFLVASRDITSH